MSLHSQLVSVLIETGTEADIKFSYKCVEVVVHELDGILVGSGEYADGSRLHLEKPEEKS